MITPLALLVLLLCASTKFSKNISLSCFSISQTQSIKGFFVITIFFSHFCSYVTLEQWYDSPMQIYCLFLGQLMVAPFLFYSGYGIFESIKNKGNDYIKNFPKQRIFKTIVHFDFAIILFLILDQIIGKNVTMLEFLLSLIAWKDIGNSNWFIFAILCAYISTFIGLVSFKGNLKGALVVIFIMSLVYIAVLSHVKAPYWYDTILAFPLGCAFSLYKEKIDVALRSKFIMLGGVACIFVLLLTKIDCFLNAFINSQIALISFSATLLFLSLRFNISSRILKWFGKNVFGIYILQRLPMNFFSHHNLNEYNRYLFFVICFACTLIFSVSFSKWNEFIDKKILKI